MILLHPIIGKVPSHDVNHLRVCEGMGEGGDRYVISGTDNSMNYMRKGIIRVINTDRIYQDHFRKIPTET